MSIFDDNNITIEYLEELGFKNIDGWRKIFTNTFENLFGHQLSMEIFYDFDTDSKYESNARITYIYHRFIHYKPINVTIIDKVDLDIIIDDFKYFTSNDFKNLDCKWIMDTNI